MTGRLRIRVARLAIALSAPLALCACGSAPDIDQTGASPTLPEQDQTLLPPIKIARPQGWKGAMPTVPRGFSVTPIATGLKVPRQILVLPNGDILVAEGLGGQNVPKLRPKDIIAGYIKSMGKSGTKGGDRITLLRDSNGDGRTDLQTVLIEHLNAPYGMALVGGDLYVADQDALLRFAYRTGDTRITTPGQLVTELPSRPNHHWTKSLAASADGAKLYVGIGSNSNVGERGMAAEQDRAVIWEIDRATGAHRTYASGIRNPTALAINPANQTLWAVANERDELGARLVPDYLTSVRPGAFYGWPYSYYGNHADPRVHPQRPDMVRRAVAPDYALGSHVAALGLLRRCGRFRRRLCRRRVRGRAWKLEPAGSGRLQGRVDTVHERSPQRQAAGLRHRLHRRGRQGAGPAGRCHLRSGETGPADRR